MNGICEQCKQYGELCRRGDVCFPCREEERNSERTGKWYYAATVHDFGGFVFVLEGAKRPEEADWGPFDTFSEAKRDALAYFRTDITYARLAIQEIKQTKKPKSE
jgi:hypothetical protein